MAEGNRASTKTIDQNLYDKKNFDNLGWVDDVFDILDDDDDNDNDELENKIEEYNQDFDFDNIDTNLDEEEMAVEDASKTNDDQDNQIFEEQQVLSQKLSQLSTKDDNDQEQQLSSKKKRSLSTPSTPDVASKKIRILDDKKDQIPEYLQATNKSFDKIMTDLIMNTATTITVEDLRQLAILKHKIAVINIDKELWTVYLKSGTGQWKTPESGKTNVDRRIWPMQVKKMMSSKKSNTIVISEERDEQKICETVVHEYLEELNNIIEQYQNEFDKKKNYLMDYIDDDLEKAIETCVKQHSTRPLQMKLNYEIALLEYDYDSEILEREYLQLKPTECQIQIAQRLYDLRFKYLESKQELIELKQRILCNKPTKSMYPTSLSSISTSIIDPMMNEKVRQQQRKDQQEQLTDSMIASIIEAEDTIHEYQELFDKEVVQLSVNDKNANAGGLTGKLIDLICRRFKIIHKKLNYIYNFRINYFLRSRYGDLEDKINKSTIDFSPTMIIDTSFHQLTDEQLKLLNRGPTYVPPCQMYVSSSYVSMNDMIQKQYKLLQHNLSIVFEKYDGNTARSMFINKEIKDVFTSAFSIPLPASIYQRALYEKQLVESIRKHLKMNNLILRRTADQRNVFYLGNQKEFDEKGNEFMTKSDAFEVSEIIDNNNLRQTREYLIKMIKSMNSEVEKIFSNKKFYKDLLKYLYIDVDKIQLPYLYFLPDVSKKNTLSVKPIIVSQGSATSRLAQFLDDLLRPVIQRYTESITFINGADFIRKLNRYTDEEHRLHSRTIFTTINISNYHTMDSHKTMLTVLKDFLSDHLSVPAVENISITKIIDLTTLFLNNNRFYYDNKIYRFTKGSPSSLSLSETLCQIYAFQFHKALLREPFIRSELYGQCKNQIFFTWNESVNAFRQLLQTIGTKYPNVKFEVKMGFKSQFLNAHIENQNGTLYSCVYHDPNNQKYTLPYVIGDAKVAHSHWFRSALIRAVRYCTSVFDFNQERIYLEITCLTNGYSLEFIERRINQFFTHFDANSLRLSLDQNVYDKLRHRLFNFISEQHHYFNKSKELEKNDQQVRLSYLYQFGSKHKFNKELQKILSKKLYTPPPTASTNQIKIILTTKQQYSLNALLSQQKPSHQLLNKEKTIF